MGTATLTSVASICLASFLLIASTGQERKSSRPELRIRVEPDEVEVGKEVIVKLIFRNTSNKAVTLVETNPYADYKWTVKDQRGEDAPLTVFGKRIVTEPQEHFRRLVARIKSGQQIEHEVSISKLFDLSKPGTYFVTAKRVAYTGESMTRSIEVVSNTLRLNIF